MKFEVINAPHFDRHNVEHPVGGIVESRTDLEQRFLNKFKRRPDLETGDTPPAAQEPVAPQIRPPGTTDPVKTPAKGKKPAKPAVSGTKLLTGAVDVSPEFDLAPGSVAKVFKLTDGNYAVVATSAPGEPLNTTPLKYREVVPFLEKQFG